jgi:hypothetical protein
MTIEVKTAREAQGHARLFRNLCFSHLSFSFISWKEIYLSHLARRGVPSIYLLYGVPAKSWVTYFHCSCEFFLGLQDISLRSPTLCSRLSGLLCGLVPDYGSVIKSRLSQFGCLSPRCFVTSNLGRCKATYSLYLQQFWFFFYLLPWRSDHH